MINAHIGHCMCVIGVNNVNNRNKRKIFLFNVYDVNHEQDIKEKGEKNLLFNV